MFGKFRRLIGRLFSECLSSAPLMAKRFTTLRAVLSLQFQPRAGEPQRLCEGHSVAIDPAGRYLVVKVNADPANYLVRYSLADRTEQRLERSARYLFTSAPLAPHAIAADGRILFQIAPLDSWYWPAAVVDPQTGP